MGKITIGKQITKKLNVSQSLTINTSAYLFGTGVWSNMGKITIGKQITKKLNVSQSLTINTSRIFDLIYLARVFVYRAIVL